MATALSLPSMTLLSTQMATVNVNTLKITTLTLCTGYTDSALLGDGRHRLALADSNARAPVAERGIHVVVQVQRPVTLKPSYRR